VKRPRIGFIGLGTMGKPMAENLLKAGYVVSCYDVVEDRIELLSRLGAKACTSLDKVFEAADMIITMLPNTEAVKEVALGAKGLLTTGRRGQLLVDMSTISPSETRRIGAALAERGIDMIDAPVSGGEIAAQAGTLSIIVGGTEEAVKRAMPILKTLGKIVVHMGGLGCGQIAKLVVNTIGTLNLLAVCEGLVLASKAGLDCRKVLEVAMGGAAASWMLEHLAPKMLDRDFRPGFKVRLNRKDLRLILELAEQTGTPLPATALAYSLFNELIAHNEGELGNQALIKCFERLANTEVKG